MKEKVLLYGATGYTGNLIIQTLLKQGIQPVLAGRNINALQLLGKTYALETIAFQLHDVEAIKSALANCKIVIHAAGPFIHTYEKMLQACIATQTHYLDITGEYQVFEGCKAQDTAAQKAGIMVLPGVGFDVVPSDCLANALKEKMPDAQYLSLAFAALKGGFSRGTAKTMVENLGEGGTIRQHGKLQSVAAAYHVREVDFGSFKTTAVTIPWGDISTAYSSTGIPNIQVYMSAPASLISQMKRSNYLRWLFKLSFVKNFLKQQINKRPPGPNAQQREAGRSYFWGCVENSNGNRIEMRLQTPEGYHLTALTTALIAKKVYNNQFKIGYQTPATAYGKDIILEIENCKYY